MQTSFFRRLRARKEALLVGACLAVVIVFAVNDVALWSALRATGELRGPAPTPATPLARMPALLTMSMTNAKQVLARLGVSPGKITTRIASDEPVPYPHGMVVAQSPFDGSLITRSTKITLVIAP